MLFRIFTLFFVASTAYSASLSFTGACQEDPLLSIALLKHNTNLGKLTVVSLRENEIEFEADEDSIKIMFNLNTSGVIETVNEDPSLTKSQIRFYGWCYEVNGEILPILASDYEVKANDNINWFYGYSLYDAGQWGEMCQKAYLIRPRFLCD